MQNKKKNKVKNWVSNTDRKRISSQVSLSLFFWTVDMVYIATKKKKQKYIL